MLDGHTWCVDVQSQNMEHCLTNTKKNENKKSTQFVCVNSENIESKQDKDDIKKR